MHKARVKPVETTDKLIIYIKVYGMTNHPCLPRFAQF